MKVFPRKLPLLSFPCGFFPPLFPIRNCYFHFMRSQMSHCTDIKEAIHYFVGKSFLVRNEPLRQLQVRSSSFGTERQRSLWSHFHTKHISDLGRKFENTTQRLYLNSWLKQYGYMIKEHTQQFLESFLLKRWITGLVCCNFREMKLCWLFSLPKINLSHQFILCIIYL